MLIDLLSRPTLLRRLRLRGAFALLLQAEMTTLLASSVGHAAALWWLAGHAGAQGLTIYSALMALLALISLPLLSPLGDRVCRRCLIVWSQALLVVEAVALMALALVGGLSVATLCACGALATWAQAVVQPARTSLLLDLLPATRVSAAIRVRRGIQAVGTLCGPALSGLALSGGGVSAAFTLQALLTMAAWTLARRTKVRARSSSTCASEAWRASLLAGLRAKWQVRVDRWWSLTGALMMVFFLPATGLLLPLRLQVIGASPIWLGLCGSALSLGVLAGVLGLADRCMARLGRLRAMFAAIAVCGLSVGLIGAVERPWALTLCFGVIGICMSITQLMGQTHRSLAVPEDFRARMASAQLTLSHLAAAMAPLVAGLCLRQWPVEQVYGLMSAGFLVSGLALLLVPDLRLFLAASTKEACGWYQRRYPEAIRRAGLLQAATSPPPPR